MPRKSVTHTPVRKELLELVRSSHFQTRSRLEDCEAISVLCTLLDYTLAASLRHLSPLNGLFLVLAVLHAGAFPGSYFAEENRRKLSSRMRA